MSDGLLIFNPYSYMNIEHYLKITNGTFTNFIHDASTGPIASIIGINDDVFDITLSK